MKQIIWVKFSIQILLIILVCFIESCSPKSVFTVSSPEGNIIATLSYDDGLGTIMYRVESDSREIISESPIGINSDRGDFRTGMTLVSHSRKVIDETYTLPQGKVSNYHNHVNEQTLRLNKNGQDIDIVFRVYNDGVAFSFVIPGEGNIEIYEESSANKLTGENFTYWGQSHPNRYGYENALGPLTADTMSVPVLAHLEDQDHFVLMAQAATYGHYIQPHFQRSASTFRFCFPMDQARLGPVRTSLPFHSPWRMIIISPDNAGKIVESYLAENLNPPTDTDLLDPDGEVKDWVQPGLVMWDYIAGDRDNPRMWINAVAEMGWKYYMADAGFARRWGGADSIPTIVDYAASKNVNVIGWAHTREFDNPDKAAVTMGLYAEWGLKGAKIDFFDHNTLSDHPREWLDHEDTQQSLQMRDWIFDLGIKNEFLLELHGNTMPTGERRRYPNLMTLEGVDGMERRAKPAANDLTIPYVRNVMGPVSYTIIHFERSPGTHAYQMAMSIVYEAGLKIFAEHGEKLLEWPGREMIKDIPSGWDETRFIEGMPASHIIIARRKGQEWYIGGMTEGSRRVTIPLKWLAEGDDYNALIFTDQSHDTMHRETKSVTNTTELVISMLERGGFAIRLSPGTEGS